MHRLIQFPDADVVEQSPGTRTINVQFMDYSSKRFRVFLPYVIFIFPKITRGLHIAFKVKPFKSQSDKLLFPSLPNVYEGLLSCSEKSISYFWSSIFYAHPTWKGMVALKHTFESFDNWAKMGEKAMEVFKKWPKKVPGKMNG